MIDCQNFNAKNCTFSEVNGNQHNYNAQQINIWTAPNLSGPARDVVKWLNSQAFDAKHQYVSEKLRQPNTGLWLLEDQRFKDWLSAKGSFLWLHGIPGSGKTVLTSTVIDTIHSQTPAADYGFAYFYADFTEPRTRQPKHILRSLLAQLLSRKPDMVQAEFSNLIEEMTNNHEPPSDVSALASLIIKACGQYADATIVLDALDECEYREEFLPCFEELHESGNIRVLVTSRKEKDIRDVFRMHVTIALDQEREHIHADMEKHIRQQLDFGRGFSKIPQAKKDIIITSLLERAEGMFRWVQCQLDQIRTIRTNKKIMEAMKNLPKGLSATYDRILEKVLEDDVEFAQKTLSWLLVSVRPLRLTEVVEALAVDVPSRLLDRDATLNDEQALLEICSSLVAYNEDTDVISLSHYTVQEYLLAPQSGSDTISKFQTSTYRSHQDLCRISLTYILLDDFSEDPCETQSAYDARANEYPFLDYAARSWAVHAEQCPGAEDVFELSLEFLGSNTITNNYTNYLRATLNMYIDKPPVSVLTNARLTWIFTHISPSPPIWYNDELGQHGTPLINAVSRNDLEMINFLIDVGADIDKPANHHVFLAGVTPLFLAAADMFWDAFDLLVDRGADPNKGHTVLLETALHQVCTQGRLDKAKRLLEVGCDPNGKNRHGFTALHSAIQGGSLETVKFLVEAGTEIVSSTNLVSGGESNKTAMHSAIDLQNEAVMEYLLDHCPVLGHLNNVTLDQIRWAEGKPYFARLRQAIDSEGVAGLNHQGFFTCTDVMRVRCILQGRLKLPPSVTAIVLDHAEYWVRSTARRDELWVIDQNTPERPYVQVRVPGWGGASPVRRVVFRTRSHDQGFSDFPEQHGTYRWSCTWFEVRVKPEQPGTKSINFQFNVHASWVSRDHINVWDVRDVPRALQDWLSSLKCGCFVEVYAFARYPGWRNFVECAEVEVYSAWVIDS